MSIVNTILLNFPYENWKSVFKPSLSHFRIT